MANPAYSIPTRAHYEEEGAKLRRHPVQTIFLRRLATAMDSQFGLPYGIRVGWDGILGFIPGFGDLVTNCVSLAILAEAARLGCPPIVILRMAGNLIVDNILDAIPILGNFADIYWKANLKNVALAGNYLSHPGKVTLRSRLVVGFTLTGIFVLGLGFLVLSIYAFFAFLRFLVGVLG